MLLRGPRWRWCRGGCAADRAYRRLRPESSGLAGTAIFVALSVVTRNAVIIGLLYALLWETVLGGYVPGVRNVSVRQWALAAAERLLGDRATMWGVTSEVSLTAALALLAVATIGAVVLAVRRLQTLRLTSAD